MNNRMSVSKNKNNFDNPNIYHQKKPVLESDDDSEDIEYESILVNSMRELSAKRSHYSKENEIYSRTSEYDNNKQMKPIDHRIEAIRSVLEDTDMIRPMIDLDSCDTEVFCDTKVNKKIINFKELCKKMDLQIKYIKSGTTGHTFKAYSNQDPSVAFAFKICAYPKENYGSIHNDSRPENTELRVLKLLSYFVVTKNSPHLVLPITTFHTAITTFVKIPQSIVNLDDEKNNNYIEFVEKYKKGKFENLVSVLISEWANGGDLLDYIRSNYKKMTLHHWRVIFFQILYTLALIHKKYPTFRHNDMKANNILVQLTENKTDIKHYSYYFDKYKFIIKDIGIQIKIWDFDFSSIDGHIENDKVNAEWANKINVNKSENKYYDMHYFFNTLSSKRFFPEFYDGGVPPEIVDFVNRIIPSQFRRAPRLVDDKGDYVLDKRGKPTYYEKFVNSKGRIQINTEITTPFKVITEDILFEKYRFINLDKKNNHPLINE